MKNIVVIPMMIPKDKDLHKFGGWSWMEYSKKAWEYWCKKNNCELVILDQLLCDIEYMKITWQRYYLFDIQPW